MHRLGIICSCILLSSSIALAEEDEEDKAPPPETFTEEEAEEPKLGDAGPWDKHPNETPVTAGPWAVDRKGSAPTDINRDGSAREPAPPTATWGATVVDPDAIEDSPWAKTRDQTGVKLAPLGAHFPVRILGHEPDALLIEVPMLIAQSPNQFDGKDYWLIVECG